MTLSARAARFAIYSAAMSAAVAVGMFLFLGPLGFAPWGCHDICVPVTEGCPTFCRGRYAEPFDIMRHWHLKP